MFEAEFWVAVAFVIFVVGLIYLGVHRRITDALDHRAARIRAELDEARKLREEAAALLADYQRRQQQAEGEAAAIVAEAQAEAGRIAAEAKTRIEDMIQRRTAMAQAKIGQAEAQALADVRAAAADAATAAAETILVKSVTGQKAEDLVARGIEDVRAKLN